MKSLFIFLITLACIQVIAAQTIYYNFSAPNAAHHEAEISITVDKLPAGPAYFRMSRSSPGRYATHEFGKNVYNIKAFDASGKALQIEKSDADVYRINSHKGFAKVTYTLFGNYADGTYAGIDPSTYHLNMPATFMWVKGLDKAPITIHFTVPDKNWKIATQLKPTADATTFTAPGLQYFMDSPTKLGELHIQEWKVENTNGKQQSFRLALEADATEAAVESMTNKLKLMVKEAAAVFGEFPAYDYGQYTFIASINPYVRGDGMEHRNSTMITTPRNFNTINNVPGVFSHEFFHCWNVERIRPKSLEPFNFEKSNMSEALWVAEGFTQYYGELILARAGLSSEESFLGSMTGLVNTKMNTPGAQNYTPIESSQSAVFVDAGVAVDQTNYPSRYSSYYTYGGAIALALDLDLRANQNTTLDKFMQELWKRHGKPEKPYTIPDLEAALAAITNKNYAADFFQKYVYGHQSYDYASRLIKAGLELKKAPAKAFIGNVNYTSNPSELTLAQPPVKGTPIYNAGVDVGDVILEADRKNITIEKDFQTILEQHKTGDKIHFSYKHRNNIVETELEMGENKVVYIVTAANQTTEQTTFKKAWLSSKVK